MFHHIVCFCFIQQHQKRLLCATCCLDLPDRIYKRKDVVSKRKTKTYLPPPQKTTQWFCWFWIHLCQKQPRRLYLWVWAFVHLKRNTCISVRKNDGRWLHFFTFSLALFVGLVSSHLHLSCPVASPHSSLPCLLGVNRWHGRWGGICGNQTVIQLWKTRQIC